MALVQQALDQIHVGGGEVRWWCFRNTVGRGAEARSTVSARIRVIFSKVVEQVPAETVLFLRIGEHLLQAFEILFLPVKEEFLDPVGEGREIIRGSDTAVGVTDSGWLERDVAV